MLRRIPFLFLILLLAVEPLTGQTIDSSFQPQIFNPATVEHLAMQPDGKLLVAGNFTFSGTERRPSLIRLDPSGKLDVNFAPAITGNIEAIGIQSDGRILVAGMELMHSDTAIPSLVQLFPDGTLDPSFQLPVDTINHINNLALQEDGKILISRQYLERFQEEKIFCYAYFRMVQLTAPFRSPSE